MNIEDGDIVFFERGAERKMGNDGNYHWVESGSYPFGHAEIGSHINMSHGADGEPVRKNGRWVGDEPRVTWGIGGNGNGSTELELACIKARVYRSRESAETRTLIADAMESLSHGTSFGSYRAVTAGVRSNAYLTSSRHRGLLRKYWPRVVAYDGGAQVDHVMKNAFCSELVVASIQVAAMLASAPAEGEPDDDATRFARAQQHPLWLEARSKATLPKDLERLLRTSPKWEYLGVFAPSRNPEEVSLTKLRSVINRALAHYNDRFTMGGLFKWTSDSTAAMLPVLRSIANAPNGEAANLRFAIAQVLPGVLPAMGKRSKPWAMAVPLRRLDKGSRLYRCLILAVAQGAADEFQFDPTDVERARGA